MRLLYVLLLAAIVPLVSSAAPTGITHYANVTITYNGLAAFPSSFQQMITANVLNYTSVMTYNGNSANFELYYANDTVIPAWIESNSSNTLTIWANVVGGFYAPTKIYAVREKHGVFLSYRQGYSEVFYDITDEKNV